MTTLYQKAKTGAMLYWTIMTKGPDLFTTWGQMHSKKPQNTRKTCQPMNVGRSNATTAEEQAVLEMEAKITKRKKEGYYITIQEAKAAESINLTLDNLPISFCPTKPISKSPQGVIDGKNTYGQRKRNGHCIILKKTESGKKGIYSRRMETLTEVLSDIPELKKMLDAIPHGSLLLTEYCYVDRQTGEDSPRKVATIVRRKNRNEALEHHEGLSLLGKFECVPLDYMWHEGSYLGNIDFLDRYEYMKEDGLDNILELYYDWREMIPEAKKKKWEGFVLRVPGKKSHIGYSLNGKADRKGCYKFKLLKEDDFIITRAEKGKSGKHVGFYAQFFLAQYDKAGNMVDCGKCGPGKLSHKELEDLTFKVDSGDIAWPRVVEIEYQSRHSDSFKLEFPQFVRLRDDKSPEECILDI